VTGREGEKGRVHARGQLIVRGRQRAALASAEPGGAFPRPPLLHKLKRIQRPAQLARTRPSCAQGGKWGSACAAAGPDSARCHSRSRLCSGSAEALPASARHAQLAGAVTPRCWVTVQLTRCRG
jgi:hypothetical protein